MSFYVISTSGQTIYDKLEKSKDLVFIEKTIAGDDTTYKQWLCSNPNLSDKHIQDLANDADMYVRIEVAKKRNLPSAILKQLQEDTEEFVRLYALSNYDTEFAIFEDAVLHGRFTNSAYQEFSEQPRVLEDFEIFNFLWAKGKMFHKALTRNLNWSLDGYRKADMSRIDPRCVDIIHDEIRNNSANTTKVFRETYVEANNVSTLPELLDLLKDDKHRPVINGIARNPHAWSETHEYLATKHKTPDIRLSIARVTKDNFLLNKIYRGTKSKEIRETVENNPVFVDLHS